MLGECGAMRQHMVDTGARGASCAWRKVRVARGARGARCTWREVRGVTTP